MSDQEAKNRDILIKVQEKYRTIYDSLDEEFKRNSCLMIEYYHTNVDSNISLKNLDEA
jgi:hypothetical protein